MDARSAGSLLELVEVAGPGLMGLDRKALFDQLDERYPELLEAVGWFLGHGRADEAIRLARSLVPFWQATKRLQEGSTWFDRILAAPGDQVAARGRACVEAGQLAFLQGDDDRAATLHRRAIEIGRRISDGTVEALALSGLARIALRSHDVAEARRLCLEALPLTEGLTDPSGRSSAVHVLGVAAQMGGDLLEAREWMTERIALARTMGSYGGLSMELSNLSMVERQLGDLGHAEELAREALGIFAKREDEWAIPYGLNSLAAVARDRGEVDRAAILIGAAEAMVEAQGAAWPPDERPHYEATVAALTDAIGPEALERIRAAGRSLTPREAVDLALRATSTG